MLVGAKEAVYKKPTNRGGRIRHRPGLWVLTHRSWPPLFRDILIFNQNTLEVSSLEQTGVHPPNYL